MEFPTRHSPRPEQLLGHMFNLEERKGEVQTLTGTPITPWPELFRLSDGTSGSAGGEVKQAASELHATSPNVRWPRGTFITVPQISAMATAPEGVRKKKKGSSPLCSPQTCSRYSFGLKHSN